MRISSFVATLFILGSAGMAAGCVPARTNPLASGTYVPRGEALPATLELDLAAGRAVLRTHDASVELRLERIEDPREWPTDCGTMRGPAHVELARIIPAGFDLAGVHYRYDGVRAGCGSGVELVETGRYESWAFDRAASGTDPKSSR